MTRRLRGFFGTANLVRYALSFVLAFTVWAWVTNERDPEQVFRATDVVVVAENIPEGLEVVGTLPTVDVELKGPQSVIRTISLDSIEAVIDLGDAHEPGEYRRDVEIRTRKGLRTRDADPDSVTVTLDRVVAREFTVEPLEPEDLPRNLSVTAMVTTPEVVTVTSVQQNVDRVARVVVDTDIAGEQGDFSRQVTPRAIDADGNVVDNVDIVPRVVTLNVSIEVRGKEVPVFVRCADQTCAAAPGFELVGQPLPSPSTVLIDGSREALAAVQYIYTTPIDTSAIAETTVLQDIPLDISTLPDGITVETLVVDVSVQVQQTVFPKSFETVPITVFNVRPDTQVSLNPATISLTVEGSRTAIATLTLQDVNVFIDVANAAPGTFTVTPRVSLPGGLYFTSQVPQVTVTVSRVEPSPTARPAPSPTPSPAPTPTP